MAMENANKLTPGAEDFSEVTPSNSVFGLTGELAL